MLVEYKILMLIHFDQGQISDKTIYQSSQQENTFSDGHFHGGKILLQYFPMLNQGVLTLQKMTILSGIPVFLEKERKPFLEGGLFSVSTQNEILLPLYKAQRVVQQVILLNSAYAWFSIPLKKELVPWKQFLIQKESPVQSFSRRNGDLQIFCIV